MKSLFTWMVLMAVGSVGCSSLGGSLRRDLDDQEIAGQPTVGGRWSERSWLNDEESDRSSPGAVGHVDRRVAGNADPELQGGMQSDEPDSERVSEVLPPVRRNYKNGSRATRADFLDESQNEGSLWASDGQTNYYFTKNKIRGVGDIVSIIVDADFVRDLGIEVRKGLSSREKEIEFGLAQQRIMDKQNGAAGDQVATGAAAPDRYPADQAKKDDKKSKEAPQVSLADVDVAPSLSMKANDILMGEILERYPNGNYKIRATKKVPYKNGAARFVTVLAVAKGSDISEEDTIGSGKLYEYRIDAHR